MNQPLIILTGPTAVGKTNLSIRLAKAIGGEIISADSMQVYRGMDIGTAKIKPEEMQGVRHVLIDEFEPDETFNVMVFQQRAKEAIEEMYQKGKVPILAGGTGFYIQAVLYDIQFGQEEPDCACRQKLKGIFEQKGSHYLWEQLKAIDEKSAAHIHENNVKKVIRALEFYARTGTRFSEHNERERNRRSPYHFAYFVLNMPRDLLYARIDERIDEMLKNGLVQEVETLRKKGYGRELVSMQGLGYKEILDYLDGKISLREAIYRLKRDTRHFAKRQLTWFRRERQVQWLEKRLDFHEDEILDQILKTCKEKKII